MTNKQIGALLREQRRGKGVTMPELGETLGVSEQMIQKYETGQSPLTVVRLVAAAFALGCRTIDLIPPKGRKP